MENLKPGEYECAACHGVFSKGWPEKEAAAEFAERFEGCNQGDAAVVCDDCYKKMGF